MTPLLGTFSAGSVRGYRGQAPASTGLIPEYWWRADSGLSTSGWTASAGGLDFTFFNVASANSSTGVYFNGSNGYGLTSNAASNIDAKHIFIRTDSVSIVINQTILGGTQNTIHEWYYSTETGDPPAAAAFIVEIPSGGPVAYAAEGGAMGSKVTWNDFVNYTAPRYFLDTNTTGTDLTVYVTPFTNRFRWNSGFGIYLGRRGAGDYLQGYVKEVAIFTTALTDTQAKSFRSTMYTRWP